MKNNRRVQIRLHPKMLLKLDENKDILFSGIHRFLRRNLQLKTHARCNITKWKVVINWSQNKKTEDFNWLFILWHQIFFIYFSILYTSRGLREISMLTVTWDLTALQRLKLRTSLGFQGVQIGRLRATSSIDQLKWIG